LTIRFAEAYETEFPSDANESEGQVSPNVFRKFHTQTNEESRGVLR
jgi:hypothetical protein